MSTKRKGWPVSRLHFGVTGPDFFRPPRMIFTPSLVSLTPGLIAVSKVAASSLRNNQSAT
jgi:hypothetical protein